MNALLSVVLPVYNGEKYLEESIKSIIDQTYMNWELLILDDCSSDCTAEIALRYQAMDERIRYYRNEHNLRLPGNLNKGFKLSKGEFLTWTSDDNKYRPTAFEKMLRAFSENPSAQLVFAPYQIMDEDGKYLQVIDTHVKQPQDVLSGNIVGACFMYTRRAYEEIGEYNTELMLVEDWDYWQRMISRFDFFVLDETLYDYRWHANSLTSTKKKEQYGFVMEKMLLKNRDLFGKLDIVTAYRYYSHLFNCRKMQKKRNPDIVRYYGLKSIYVIIAGIERICKKASRIKK